LHFFTISYNIKNAKKMKKRRLLFILLSLILLSSTFVYAEEAGIDGVNITREGDLQVSFNVINVFTGEVEEAIASGIPTSFTFTVELHRKRGLWFDRTVVKRRFMHTVKYDTLREEYSVTLEEKGPAAVATKDSAAMQTLMANVDALHLLPMEKLNRGEKYRISIRAEGDAVHLPFPLNRLLFFVSFGSFKTGWHLEEFLY